MPPIKPTEQEEADFMNGLLSGLGPSASLPKPNIAVASLPPTRTASNISTTSSATLINDDEIAFLLDGAEDWDWDEDFTSPKKSPVKKMSPVKSRSRTAPNAPPRYSQVTTRCVVQTVSEDLVKGRLEKVCFVNSL